ncbi:MAG: hypothetical protein HY964_07270 [Ignavibacteriales bacterium]|nr:hypothetical protein [Ignavibacteriales bacterium]
MAKKEKNADINDVGTLDGVIKAIYESLSFATGSQPDFDRYKTLLRPQALLVPPKSDKAFPLQPIDIDLYSKKITEHIVLDGMERKGQHFTEIARRTLSFGMIVQIFSTFELRAKSDDPKPLQRGIYGIQLLREQQRWWIVSVMWDFERADLVIPKAYLV